MTLLRSRKTGDEVHLNLVPLPLWNRDWLQSSSRSLMFCLDATANVTFFNITSNVLLHIGPPELRTNVLVHLGASRMNGQRDLVCRLLLEKKKIYDICLSPVVTNN